LKNTTKATFHEKEVVMERAIIKSIDGSYYFFDDPEWGVDISRSEAELVLDVDKETSFHACKKSFLYDDLDGYVDELQDEESLPDGEYLVTYFARCGDDLVQLVDYGITKQQLIANVSAQKYVEGADYFLRFA
jgi:hypothetical protein